MSKHEKRKPRNQRVGGTTRDEVDSATILVNRRTGKIYFETPVVNTYSEVACDRAKGEKILSRISVPPEDLEADPNAAMFANSDRDSTDYSPHWPHFGPLPAPQPNRPGPSETIVIPDSRPKYYAPNVLILPRTTNPSQETENQTLRESTGN